MASSPQPSGESNLQKPSRVMSRTIGAISWFVLFTFVVFRMLNVGQPQVVETVEPSQPEVEEEEAYFVQPFSLTERSGETVTLESLKGKTWIASFIFTYCEYTCPALTGRIASIAEQTSELDDVVYVTFTVDPKRDTPERLTQYAQTFGADPEKWLFLTGEQDKLYELIKSSFLQQVSEDTSPNRRMGFEFAHTNRLLQVDPNGQIIGSYLGTDERQVAVLRRVLQGKTEIPPENQFARVSQSVVPALTAEAEKAIEVLPTPETAVQETEEPNAEGQAPAWVMQLPLVNAVLNGVATVLLLLGFVFIKSGQRTAHQYTMLLSFLVSVAFLACYLTYHTARTHYLGEASQKFQGGGVGAQVYYTILLTHVVLAAGVPVLALMTFYRAFRQQWEQHKFIARITFPIWVYVSVTGVLIYLMLYQMN